MNIEKVKICNFKNYEGEIIFDLNKQITILQGDNGFGKSTFFDAIEWCLTNKISRYDGNDTEIKKDIINKNCDTNNQLVSVEMKFGGNKLTRYFNVVNGDIKKTQVKILNKKGISYRGQEKVENYLKQGTFDEVDFGKGVYGQLIKQTYILSQDQVTDFINSDDAGGRYRSLANIMGLKSMLNETDNAKKILAALRSKEKEIELVIKNDKNIVQSKKELKRTINMNSLNEKLTQIGVSNSESNIEQDLIGLENALVSKRDRNERFLKLYDELNLDEYISFDVIKNQISLKEKSKQNILNKINKRKEILSRIEKTIEEQKNEKNNLDKYNEVRLKIKKSNFELEKLGVKAENIDETNEKLNLLKDKASKLEYHITVRDSLTRNNSKIKELDANNTFLERKIQTLLNRKEKLKRTKIKLSSKTDEDKNKIMIELISNIKDIEKHVKKNKFKECPVCSSIPEEGLEEAMNKNITLLNVKIQDDTRYLEKAMNLLNKIETYLENFETKLNSHKSQIRKNMLTIERLSEELRIVELNSLFDKEFFTSSSVKNEEMLSKTSTNINRLQKGFNTLIKIKRLKEQLNDIHHNSNFEKFTKSRTEKDIEVYLDKLTNVKESLLNNETSSTIKIGELSSVIRGLEKIISRVSEFIVLECNNKKFKEIYLNELTRQSELKESAFILSTVKNILSDMKINNEIEQQVSLVEEKITKRYNMKIKLESVIEVLAIYLNKRSEVFGNEAKEFLNKDNSTIQRFFRYLNPLPSNSRLYFEGEDEELNIKIDIDKEYSTNKFMSNAKNVLSSGQLNVLAISIFLAINDGQKTHSLNFVAIDDPIQNMDNVNQYSICDVLGQIKKQLIFSTHDMEFLKLFIKKNEHRKEDIQVYNFTSPYLKQDKLKKISFS